MQAPSEPWNRPVQPGAEALADGTTALAEAPAASPIGDAAASVKAGAMKAATAALAAARTAAKKVSSARPEPHAAEAGRSVHEAVPGASAPRPEMHYTAAGVRGTAVHEGPTPPGARPVAPPAPPGVPGGSAAGPHAPQPQVPTGVTPPATAGPRRVRLAISRVDPWSVMKLAFLLSFAVAIMTVVATAVFWSVLNSLEVFVTIQQFVEEVVGQQSDVNLIQYVEFERVVSLSALVAICNLVLTTAIATIMAFLYNITAALVGGVHMTLTDD